MKAIKKIIKKLLGGNYFTKNLMEKLNTYRLNKYYKKMSKKVPVDDKMVIFEAFFAKKYACSPKSFM